MTHSGMLASSFNKEGVGSKDQSPGPHENRDWEDLRLTKATAIPEVSFAQESKCRRIGTFS